jgi:hypothetical protein
MSADAWWYELMGQEVGPVTRQELQRLAGIGTIQADTPVRSRAGGWRVAESIVQVPRGNRLAALPPKPLPVEPPQLPTPVPVPVPKPDAGTLPTPAQQPMFPPTKPCHYCRSTVARNAEKCPSCGGKRPYRHSPKEVLLLAAIFLVPIGGCWMLFSPSRPAESPAPTYTTITPVRTEVSEPTLPRLKVIPGLSPVDVYLNMESQGFVTKKNFGDRVFEVTCTPKEASPFLDVYVQSISDGTDSVSSITVAVLRSDRTIDETDIGVMAYVATLPYTGSQPAAAKNWVLQTWKNGGEARVGGVHFQISTPTPFGRMLFMRPE